MADRRRSLGRDQLLRERGENDKSGRRPTAVAWVSGETTLVEKGPAASGPDSYVFGSEPRRTGLSPLKRAPPHRAPLRYFCSTAPRRIGGRSRLQLHHRPDPLG